MNELLLLSAGSLLTLAVTWIQAFRQDRSDHKRRLADWRRTAYVAFLQSTDRLVARGSRGTDEELDPFRAALAEIALVGPHTVFDAAVRVLTAIVRNDPQEGHRQLRAELHEQMRKALGVG